MPNRELQWSARFESIRTGEKFSRPPCPEHYAIRSSSQAGRSDPNRHQWIPPHCRPPQPPPPPKATKADERLLYLALYRDKVAQHHAHLASQSDADKRKDGSTYHSTSSAEVSADQVQPSTRAASSSVCVAAGAHIGHAALPHAPLKSTDEIASDVKKHSLKQPAPKAPTLDGAQEGTAYIAAVTARAAFGGVAEEHLEGKHLGQLFDQWREQQEALELSEGPCGSSSSPSRHPSTASPSPRRPMPQPSPVTRGGVALLHSPRQQCSASRPTSSRGEPPAPSEADMLNTASDLGSNSSSPSKSASPRMHGDSQHQVSERRKVDRLFNVITNSKVRVESFAEQRIIRGPAREHIEGFPRLELMRLYQGPWRINV